MQQVKAVNAAQGISPAVKLMQLSRLRLSDGLEWEEAKDIRIWALLVGARYDMRNLSEESQARLAQVYDRFFGG